MNDDSFYLAQQGEPDAIAIYLNDKLSDRNLTTQAKRNEEYLVLVIVFKSFGDRETVVELVRQELTALEARSITKVQIRARREHQKDFAWEAEFDVAYPQPLPKLDLSLALEDEEEETKDGLHQTGDVIRDRYRILEVLGQGGNGITYAAEDLQQHTKVAIKALSLRHMDDWKQIELFEREAKVLSQLDHPAIPKYFDYFTIDTDEDRAFYIVQELAQGQNLAKLVEAGWRTNEKGVRKIIEQVLNILIYLHSLKPPVVHRDIKPHNLIYGNDGKVSLVDFGAVQDTYRSTMARGSTVIGTFGYMAPEQFRGQAVPATDLYALGATILFLLTHRSPSELPQERLRYNFRSKIQVSEQFSDWLQKMVEPEIETRFASARESLATLQKKQIVWFPQRKLSWQVWLAIASVGSIIITFINTNKWAILELYEIYPKICESKEFNKFDGFDRDELDRNIQELTDFVKQSKKLPKNLTYNASSNIDKCINNHLNVEILDVLIQRGVEINYNFSSERGSEIALNWLILKGFNPNNQKKVETFSNRYFHIIINDLSRMSYLIEKGLNIDTKSAGGYTLLHLASSYGDFSAIKLLLANNADINAIDQDGRTALHLAISGTNDLKIIKFLIDNNADINAVDRDGHTALHLAVMSNKDLQIVKFLVSNNAYINATSYRGKTPLYFSKNKEVTIFLKSKGAK